MLCTPLSLWLLSAWVTQEMGFVAPCLMQLMEKEQWDDLFHYTLPSQGLREGAVMDEMEQWQQKGQRAVVAGCFSRLCLLSDGVVPRNTKIAFCGRSFSGWKGTHVHRGQDKKSWCLERHQGQFGLDVQDQFLMVQAVSHGGTGFSIAGNLYIGSRGCCPRTVGNRLAGSRGHRCQENISL